MLLFPLLVLAPKTFDVVGTWVPSLPAGSLQPGECGTAISFAKNGTVRLKSATVSAVGTYRVGNETVTIVLTRRNGAVPMNPAEKRGTLRIAENGKALLLPTGEARKGMPVLLRLVRKR